MLAREEESQEDRISGRGLQQPLLRDSWRCNKQRIFPELPNCQNAGMRTDQQGSPQVRKDWLARTLGKYAARLTSCVVQAPGRSSGEQSFCGPDRHDSRPPEVSSCCTTMMQDTGTEVKRRERNSPSLTSLTYAVVETCSPANLIGPSSGEIPQLCFLRMLHFSTRPISMSALLETSLGDIVIDLLVDESPKACEK